MKLFKSKISSYLRAFTPERIDASKEVLDCIGAIYVELNDHRIVTDANESMCSVLGYERKEVIGKNWDKEFAVKLTNLSDDSEEFGQAAVRIKGGGHRMVSWRRFVEVDENNRPSRYICIGEDISKQDNYLASLHQIASILIENNDDVPYRKFTRLVGEAANADNTYLFLSTKTKDGDIVSKKVCEWGRGKFIENEDEIPELQHLTLDMQDPVLSKKIMEGQIINMRACDFSERVQFFLNRFGIKAILLIPIIVDGGLFGFIGFDNRLNDREWTISEIDFLKASVKNLEQKIIRTRVYRSLANENIRFQATMDAIEMIILVSDFATNQIIYQNAFATKKVGNTIGREPRVALQISSEDVGFEKSMDDLIDNGYPKEAFESEVRTSDGKTFYSVQVKAILWSDGRWVRLEIFKDITDKKHQEKLILDSEMRFKRLADISLEGVIIHDNGVIREVNQAFLDMIGYSREDILGKTIISLTVAPEYRDGVIKYMLGKQHKPYEIEGIRKDGSRLPVEVVARDVVFDGENLSVVVVRDITERRKAQQELIRQKERAEESNELKTQFLNNLSHEIRTPLNGIVGFTQFLSDPNITRENMKNFISIIQNSSQQLVRIIDDIIEISKLETKQVRPLIESVNLNSLLLELFSIFELKSSEKGIDLRLQREMSSQQSQIYTDRSKLLKILNNLVENAIKFTHVGEVEIGSKMIDGKLVIWVKDSGIGIEYHKQRLIFERFSQADKQKSLEYGGLGLGLSIAKENVELLGGKIDVVSEEGLGSTFTVTIPYNAVNKADETNINEEKTELIPGRVKVLIAEDEEVNYLFLEHLLVSIDKEIQIFHACNGQEAVECFVNNRDIRLVFMDLKMPVMNGVEATKAILKMNNCLPIVAVTAFSGQEERKRALQAGCVDYIVKPVNVDEFMQKCTKYLADDR